MTQTHPHQQIIAVRRDGPAIVAKRGDFNDFSDDDGSGSGSGSGGGPGTGAGGPGSGQSGAGMSLMGAMLPGGPGGPQDSADVAKEMLVDYNAKFAGADPALYRDAVIDRLCAALISKNKPSAIMLGPAGTGKTRVVEELARRIAVGDPSVPAALRDKTIYEFSLTALVAGTMYRGMMEEKLKALVAFASDPDNGAILFIDEIHQLVPSDGHGNGSHEEVAQSLKPALARGEISVVGATTDQEGRRLVGDPAFMRRFTRVGVSELNQEQTREVLEAALPGLTSHYAGQVSVDQSLLTHVVALADEHLRTLHRPDSALTLLDRAMARIVVDMHKPIFRNAIAMGGAAAGAMPLSRELVRETAEAMHGSDAVARGLDADALVSALTRIRGQDAICSQVVAKLRRDALGLFPRSKPLAWLFAGPSGVGKTEVARQVAAQVMGTEPIILNMSEYSEPQSITRLVGSSPGYIGSDSNKEMPFDPLDANPRQVIVLDEFEKSHREVQRLMLSALDTGTMDMASGKTVDFSKAIIIATTNAGRDAMTKKSLGFSADQSAAPIMDKARLTAALTANGGFEKELVGRFSWLVAFAPIPVEVYTEVVVDAYARLREGALVSNPALGSLLPAVLPDDQVQQIVADTYVADLGARSAEPAVREWIEEALDPTAPSNLVAQQVINFAPATTTGPNDAADTADTAAEPEDADDQHTA